MHHFHISFTLSLAAAAVYEVIVYDEHESVVFRVHECMSYFYFRIKLVIVCRYNSLRYTLAKTQFYLFCREIEGAVYSHRNKHACTVFMFSTYMFNIDYFFKSLGLADDLSESD